MKSDGFGDRKLAWANTLLGIDVRAVTDNIKLRPDAVVTRQFSCAVVMPSGGVFICVLREIFANWDVE
jgi:hypothetical protein